jgi:hypothetical protein
MPLLVCATFRQGVPFFAVFDLLALIFFSRLHRLSTDTVDIRREIFSRARQRRPLPYVLFVAVVLENHLSVSVTHSRLSISRERKKSFSIRLLSPLLSQLVRRENTKTSTVLRYAYHSTTLLLLPTNYDYVDCGLTLSRRAREKQA